MTAISYHRTVKDLQGLRWSNRGPFASPQWFALLEHAGTTPLIALARDGEDAIALVLQQDGRRLTACTNWYAFTFADLRTDAASDKLLSALASDLVRRTGRIDLGKLPDEDGTLARLQGAFAANGWLTAAEPCDTNHILLLKGRSFEDYLSTRPGSLRTTLKRKAKKVEVALSTRFAAADWAAYEAIYADSWKPVEGDPNMLRRFAEQESHGGRYRFALARHEGEPVAAQFWTVENNTAFIHKLAHRESAKSLSPGTTLSAALFAHVINVDGVATVDFGTGDDPYKRDWMEDVRTRWHLTCLRPEVARNWPAILRLRAKKASTFLSGQLVSRRQRG